MSTVAKLLDSLDRPLQTAPGKWMTACPCCQSRRGRPVSVRELEDGRTLLHAFCGCGTDAILSSIGLTISDLFPTHVTRGGEHQSFQSTHSRPAARDVLAALSLETSVVETVAHDLLKRRVVSVPDWKRLREAAGRIHAAKDYLHGR